MKIKSFLLIFVLVFFLPLESQVAAAFDQQIDDPSEFRTSFIQPYSQRIEVLIKEIGIKKTSFGSNSTPGQELCILWLDLARMYKELGPGELQKRFLETKFIERPIVYSDFPQGWQDATLVSIEIYFLGDALPNLPIPIEIVLKGPFIRKIDTKKRHGFFETFVHRKYNGYTWPGMFPPVKQAGQIKLHDFAEGFWYLNPFCTWQISLKKLPEGITLEKIQKMKIRLYYFVVQ